MIRISSIVHQSHSVCILPVYNPNPTNIAPTAHIPAIATPPIPTITFLPAPLVAKVPFAPVELALATLEVEVLLEEDAARAETVVILVLAVLVEVELGTMSMLEEEVVKGVMEPEVVTAELEEDEPVEEPELVE